MTFPVNVTGVDIGDFQLTCNGDDIVLSSAMLSSSSAKIYHLDVSSVTSNNGVYELTLRAEGSGIQDVALNTLAADAASTWIMDTTSPGAPLIDTAAIAADLGGTGNAIDHINANLKAAFSNFKVRISNMGTGNEAGTLYIKLTDDSAHTVTTSGETIAAGAALASRGSFANGDINSFVDGNITITAWIVDAAGNTSSEASKNIALDSTIPAAPIIGATAVSANLGSTGNTANHINLALKNSFSSFKVNIGNTAANNEAGSLTINLADSTTHATATTEIIAAGAALAARGTFIDGAIEAFTDDAVDGNDFTVTAWIIDAAGNESSHADTTIAKGLDTIVPGVTKLGNGSSEYQIWNGSSRTLTFTEGISNRSNISNAIDSKSSRKPLTYVWNAAYSTLTITNNTGNIARFNSGDVATDVIDLAGNSINLLLIDTN